MVELGSRMVCIRCGTMDCAATKGEAQNLAGASSCCLYRDDPNKSGDAAR